MYDFTTYMVVFTNDVEPQRAKISRAVSERLSKHGLTAELWKKNSANC